MCKHYFTNMMSSAASSADACFVMSVCLILMGTISLVSIIFSISVLLLGILLIGLIKLGTESRKRTTAVNA